VRVWGDLLTAAAGVAARRGLGPVAPAGAGRPGRAGPAGLVADGGGLGQRAGEKGGHLTGPNPTDRGKAGTKYHLLVDATGLPINIALSGANRHDSIMLEPLLDGLTGVKTRPGPGRPRRRPGKLHADKGYDTRRVRRYLAARGITARIVRRGIDSRERLGRHRWVVERTVAWLLAFRRLALRYDRTATTITALARLAAALICYRRLRGPLR
jgi:transposase